MWQILSASIMISPRPAEAWDLRSHNLSGYRDIFSSLLGATSVRISSNLKIVWIFTKLNHIRDLRSHNMSGYWGTFSSKKTFKCNQCKNDFKPESCLNTHIIDLRSQTEFTSDFSFRGLQISLSGSEKKWERQKMRRRSWTGRLLEGDSWADAPLVASYADTRLGASLVLMLFFLPL